MAPIQVIILLILVRLPSTLAGDHHTALHFPGYQLPLMMLAMFTCQFVLVAYIALRARSAVRELHLTTTSAAAVANGFERLLPAARWVTIFFTACYLFFPPAAALPVHLDAFLQTTHILQHIPLLPECIYITPALAAWLGFWTIQYFVEAAHRERSLPFRLATQQPTHEMPSLSQFLSMQIRHNFYLFVPLLLIVLLDEVGDMVKGRYPSAPGFVVVLSVLIFLLMTPWMITCIWATIPLAGPLRTRLDSLAAQYRLRFKNILIWKTHNAITNAAILGYLPFSRYFLMTDALLESLTDQQLEAVFAHEVGHGYHRHLWWYLAGFFGAFFFATSAADVVAPHLPVGVVQALGGANPYDNASIVLALLFLIAFIVLGFPLVSHRFEHQADFFASRHMARRLKNHPDSLPMPAAVLVSPPPMTITIPEDPPAAPLAVSVASGERTSSPGAIPPVQPAAPADPNLAGAELFISSLDTIVDLAHRSRNHRGWMHPSINERIKLLRELATSTLTQKHFARRQFRTRLFIVLFMLVTIALTVYVAMYPPPTPASATQPAASTAP